MLALVATLLVPAEEEETVRALGPYDSTFHNVTGQRFVV